MATEKEPKSKQPKPEQKPAQAKQPRKEATPKKDAAAAPKTDAPSRVAPQKLQQRRITLDLLDYVCLTRPLALFSHRLEAQTYSSKVRLASALAAASLDGLFEQPEISSCSVWAIYSISI